MSLYFELFLSKEQCEKQILYEFLEEYKEWSIYWYTLITEKAELFYLRIKLELEGNQFKKTRLDFIYEFFEIFCYARVIACGYKNYWNVVLASEDIKHHPQVWYVNNVTENSSSTFLSVYLVSLLDHDSWIYLFLSVYKNINDGWQMYHWTNISNIKKYFSGTMQRTKKSLIKKPFNTGLSHLIEYSIFDTFPLEMYFPTFEIQLKYLRTPKEISLKKIPSLKFVSKIPIATYRLKPNHILQL